VVMKINLKKKNTLFKSRVFKEVGNIACRHSSEFRIITKQLVIPRVHTITPYIRSTSSSSF
jgi:hypothetical protein